MNQYALLIYLHQDTSNTLNTRIDYVERQSKISLLPHDGVIQLQDNVLLFDQTKAHDVVVRLCQDLLSVKRPYLIVPVELSDALLVGKQSKEDEANLLKFGVRLCTPVVESNA